MSSFISGILGQSTLTATHSITVVTGDKSGSGTDGNVYLTVKSGNVVSQEEQLGLTWRNDFEKGSKDVYLLTLPEIEKVTEITIRRDSGFSFDSWYVDRVEIVWRVGERTSVFPVHRWVEASDIVSLSEFDSSLPQHDDVHTVQRQNHLINKKRLYQFRNEPNFPGRIQDIPDDEKFSNSYQLQITTLALEMFAKTKFLDFTNSEFQSYKDIEEFYGGILPRPDSIENWKSDVTFGNQRLTGVNPAWIRLCESIPEHMPVSSAMVESFLEGRTLEEAIVQKKLYLMDFRYLAKIECNEGRKMIGPTALFYSNNNGELLPIAIQLMPESGEDNPIFLPSDPNEVWLMAKLWFNSADSSHHESMAHLGLTHFLMESVCIATNRQLSKSHPLHRLLAPHFLYVLAINNLAMDVLVSEGGFVDKAMAIGRIGMFNIIRDQWPQWDLLKNGHLINDLIDRGVEDTKALPNYHYRDDSILIWNALHDYVSKVISSVYTSEEEISADHELQAWAAELSDEQNGAGIRGMLSNFQTADEIVEVVTIFIFISSVQHAAVNFMQYDQYSFPPNYPAWVKGEPPKNKNPLTEEDIVKSIANKDQMIETLVITKLLSERATQELGNFEVQYAHHPDTLQALDELKSSLNEVSEEIKRRNQERTIPYPYLNPKEIPNAISI